ncbi:hypothetical protein MNB_SM-7-289 [hydrothermal vent metagenome]|uniref:Uncharacterized protein n=1 Tax=hydrothermal vent metagenome TaxID=652676 RepID=A0A1W1BCH3_9ZZZZ
MPQPHQQISFKKDDYVISLGFDVLCLFRLKEQFCLKHIKKMREAIKEENSLEIKPIRIIDDLYLPHNIVILSYKDNPLMGLEFNDVTKKEYKKLIKRIKKAIIKDAQLRFAAEN